MYKIIIWNDKINSFTKSTAFPVVEITMEVGM